MNNINKNKTNKKNNIYNIYNNGEDPILMDELDIMHPYGTYSLINNGLVLKKYNINSIYKIIKLAEIKGIQPRNPFTRNIINDYIIKRIKKYKKIYDETRNINKYNMYKEFMKLISTLSKYDRIYDENIKLQKQIMDNNKYLENILEGYLDNKTNDLKLELKINYNFKFNSLIECLFHIDILKEYFYEITNLNKDNIVNTKIFRKKANELLSNMKIGTWLFRPSSQIVNKASGHIYNFAISVKKDNIIMHYAGYYRKGFGIYPMNNSYRSMNLDKMVNYNSNNVYMTLIDFLVLEHNIDIKKIFYK